MTTQPNLIASRIALWGGSFNPPTLAHKSLADFAFSVLDADFMHWIVSPHNPEKDVTTLAPFKDRFAMVRQVLTDRPQMIASDIEDKLGSSIMLNTVRNLRLEMPQEHLFLLLGMDNWFGFHNWTGGFAQILDYVSIVILNRPGFEAVENAESSSLFADKRVYSASDLKKSGSWYVLDNPVLDISATKVRQLLSEDKVPEAIASETFEYIKQHSLYGQKP